MSRRFPNLDSLPAIETECWQLLHDATGDRSMMTRLPVLGTIDNNRCKQRTVVLRQVQRDQRSLIIHTDLRSPKIQQIEDCPSVSLLCYEPSLEVQLRLSAEVIIHTDNEIADKLWATQHEAIRHSFTARQPPGSVLSERPEDMPNDRLNVIGNESAGRHNFAVIECVVNSLEWLMLRPEGHLRAIFNYQNHQLTTADWLSP